MNRTIAYTVDDAALLQALEALVAEKGSQVAAAKALDITPAYLNDALHGRRDIGALAARLGYRPLRVFVPDGEEPLVTAAQAARVIEKLRQRRLAESKAVAS